MSSDLAASRDDVLPRKAASIERCLRRIREEYLLAPEMGNFSHLDAMILNIERACQTAIDMAYRWIALHRLGLPSSNAEAFDLLKDADVLDAPLAERMKAMAGFRNLAVHEYTRIDLDVIRYIATEGYRDLIHFCHALGFRVADPWK